MHNVRIYGVGKKEQMSDKQKPNWEPTDLIQEAFDVATIKHSNGVISRN